MASEHEGDDPTKATMSAAAPAMYKALGEIFSIISYINIHGVGEQPEPSADGPQPIRVSKEEFARLFQLIGTTAANAISVAEGRTQPDGE